ncbi:MAG TPA: thioredoxin, partial [Dehalococcoidia bacterium]|nr:thioredoxin [Dehalococcoidia bacterium]
MAATLTSERYEVETIDDAIELYFEKGWSDGLPVVPPTEDKVLAFLAAGGWEPGEIVGSMPQRARTVTAEKVAVNAVMAGCKSEYAPVVFTAVEALLSPDHNANGANASTGGSGPFIVVNGPIAREIGMNTGHNLLGQGTRANATIGRAVRLVLYNCCANIPGVFDRSTLGHPGKYTYCVAEQEGEMAWAPLHVERGLPPGTNAVTVLAAEGPHQVGNGHSNDPEGLILTYADVLASGIPTVGYYGVIISPEHRAVFEREGWDKRRIREAIAQEAYRTYGELERRGQRPRGGDVGQADEKYFLIRDPDHLLVIAGGGEGAGWGA